MRTCLHLVTLFALAIPSMIRAQEPRFLYPAVADYGGVVELAGAVDPPQKGAKLFFDITADSKPGEVNRGLESVARYLNLNALSGHSASDVRLTLILHGRATECALSDAAFARRTSVPRNPNRPLLEELRKLGVEILVCGQSLARNQLSPRDVADDVTVAASAMTVNVNRQAAGYAYLPVQ